MRRFDNTKNNIIMLQKVMKIILDKGNLNLMEMKILV